MYKRETLETYVNVLRTKAGGRPFTVKHIRNWLGVTSTTASAIATQLFTMGMTNKTGNCRRKFIEYTLSTVDGYVKDANGVPLFLTLTLDSKTGKAVGSVVPMEKQQALGESLTSANALIKQLEAENSQLKQQIAAAKKAFAS